MLCCSCRDRNYYFDKNYSIYQYHNIKEVIAAYKFDNRKSLRYFFAEIIAAVYFNKYNGFLLVPVPCSPSSKKKRAWDQIEEISKLLKKKYRIPVYNILERKNSKSQKVLNYHERVKNLKNKIFYKQKIIKSLIEFNMLGKVVLLDDVFTSGATISECSSILKRAGFKEVYSLTIAID